MDKALQSLGVKNNVGKKLVDKLLRVRLKIEIKAAHGGITYFINGRGKNPYFLTPFTYWLIHQEGLEN
ncbi:hypothetical protein [Mycoavidus sp. B2-EB]|uniref:hypothetical protein n=1 Tax=Mycoavidus sp. B2-EB TaxID=2651972 RepID=UPI001624859E|nr:hypothetical protein [Mycoavidus sp. B2-EB]